MIQISMLVLFALPLDCQQQRTMVVDDVFALEQLDQVVASPDGQWLAVVVRRAWKTLTTHRDFFAGNDRADIWLVARHGGEAKNLTNGITDGTGYWNPVWSPDSKRLAMLSTKGGDSVRPYLWDMSTGRVKELTERSADPDAPGDWGWPFYAMVWTDTTTLLCAVMSDGVSVPHYGMAKIRSYIHAQGAWHRAAQGAHPTASVLESGRDPEGIERPSGQLIEIKVITGQVRVIAEGSIRYIAMSPTGRHLAIVTESGMTPPSADRQISFEALATNLPRTRLGILTLNKSAKVVWIDSVIDPRQMMPGTQFSDAPFSHSWSPDGEAFAVVGKDHKNDQSGEQLYVVSARNGNAYRVAGPQLKVRITAWSSSGQLLALARPALPSNSQVRPDGAADSTRLDWWCINGIIGRHRNLTNQLRTAPHSLLRTPEPNTMLGIAAGEAWQIDVQSGAVKLLTGDFEPLIGRLVWPRRGHLGRSAIPDFVIATQAGELYRTTWAAHRIRASRLPRPSARAEIAEFRPDQRLLVYTAAESSGTFLWTGDGNSSRFKRRIALNMQLGQIASARQMSIDYRTVDGDSLTGLLMLPIGYHPGRRYPLVTYVYGGLVTLEDTYRSLLDKGLVSSMNMHLLPSRGYAVLLPSIPLGPIGGASDPYVDIPKGVMAAVERVIDLGIADPERLGVMGHSYGGFTTYALVTYTRRFRAGVALAGMSNFISLYGTFFPPLRYDDYAHEELWGVAYGEAGQARMGTTPWKDLWRYLRNSPLYYADRVQTPLMIIQGDIDFVPLQQGEEFFTALYRLGKKAKFVRYWGEGHVISSPANVRDMWRQIFAWFDEHLQRKTLPMDTVTAPTVTELH